MSISTDHASFPRASKTLLHSTITHLFVQPRTPSLHRLQIPTVTCPRFLKSPQHAPPLGAVFFQLLSFFFFPLSVCFWAHAVGRLFAINVEHAWVTAEYKGETTTIVRSLDLNLWALNRQGLFVNVCICVSQPISLLLNNL